MADLKGRQNNASELRNREALIITGINRYIVECKLVNPNINLVDQYGINRYIVECKSGAVLYKVTEQQRINRYIVECK